MDSQIIQSALTSSIFFLVFHLLLFRLKPTNAIMGAMKRILISWVIGVIIGWIRFSLTIKQADNRFVFVVYFFVSLSWIITYILGVFVLFDSSLRMKYLLIISSHGNKGITRQKLYRLCNPRILVKRRLLRLVDTGVVIHRNNHYELSGQHSILSIRELLVKITNLIYS